MQNSVRFRCYPNKVQEQTLLHWVGHQRYIYNATVCEVPYFRRFAQKLWQHAGQCAPIVQQYAPFKTERTSLLNEVPSVVLRNGAVQWKPSLPSLLLEAGWDRSVVHRNHGQQVTHQATGEISHQLPVGTKKHPVGVWELQAHQLYGLLPSISIRINSIPEPSDKETAAWLMEFNAVELRSKTMVLPLTARPFRRNAGNAFRHDALKVRHDTAGACSRRSR